MKKVLLSVAFLSATFIGTRAQQTISFEASEGFTIGDINQNGWTSTPIVDANGNITGYIEDQVITSEMASDGVQSLKIDKAAAYSGQQQPIVGAFYTLQNPYTDTAEYVVGFDIYVNSEQNNTSSDFVFAGFSNDGIPFYFRTNWEGSFLVADEATNNQGQTDLFIVSTDVEWSPQVWYKVKVVISQSNGTVSYYLDNNLIYTSTGLALNNNPLEEIRFIHDNWSGFAYLDNIYIGDEAGYDPASVDSNTMASFSVYPNPAIDFIRISNGVDSIENVTITDLNGRIVKQTILDANEQINISDLAQGVYILNATSNGKTITEKIVKK